MAGQRIRLPGGGFTAIWTAEAASVVGDQMAKVAMALLVFQRTGSATLSGLAYGLTFLPPLVTGPLLVGLADRHPRRTVMVLCCLSQAGCVALMALPGLSLVWIVVGALAIAAVQVPFKAAQGATVLDVLGAEYNKAGRARLTLVRETGQLAGLAGGAAVVGVIGFQAAFLIDAMTFMISAACLRFGLRRRVAAFETVERGSKSGVIRPLVRWIGNDGSLHRLAVLIALIGITAVPDAIAVPFVVESGSPTWYVGPLLAADCLGLVLAAAVVERMPAARQRRLIAPLAVLSLAPLALFALRPAPAAAIGLLIVSGAGSAYLPLAIGELTERVHPGMTGAANGLVSMVLRTSQGLAAIAAGVVAAAMSAAMAVALFGVIGMTLSVICARGWARALLRQNVKLVRTRGRHNGA
ncbi:MFS transporter [Actinokineospora sp. HUAS TT18]|uniref:MFS transporter n=1 Tax=Actinokineospora sp. HUAS TT18 TaxID=3447451 RepID=UPI003F52762A